jgi:FkbM family methyltransferase
MSYLSKISPFSLNEKLSILKFSIGSRLINKIPNVLKHTYLLTNRLLAKGIKVERIGDNIQFKYPINQVKTQFQIKRTASDAQVFQQIIELEEYSPIIAIFRDMNISPQTMIDAGANIGLTCLYFKSHFPDINITALEPFEETYNRLVQNININHFSSVRLLKKGLWSSQIKLKADTSFRDGQDWSFRLVEACSNEPALFEATSIDEIISENNLTTIDFLKIDIEGGEVEIFKDFSTLHWLNQVKVIALEIHDEFNCREHIETNLAQIFDLSHAGELTIGINKSL